MKAATAYTTLLVWPYAVAPAVVGVLWWFLFNPTDRHLFPTCSRRSATTGTTAERPRRDDPRGARGELEAGISYNFLFFVAGLQSIPASMREAAAIDGAGPVKRFWTITLPLLSPTTFFLMVVNIVYAMFDTFPVIHATTQGGPGGSDQHPGLQGLPGRLHRAEPRLLGGPVGGADGHRHRAHRDPVRLGRAARAVLRARHGREPPLLTFLAHLVLIIGVVLVAFPVYVAFIASTHGAERLPVGPDPAAARARMRSSNYGTMLTDGMTRLGHAAAVAA